MYSVIMVNIIFLLKWPKKNKKKFGGLEKIIILGIIFFTVRLPGDHELRA